MTYTGTSSCKKVEYINIRGHVGIHTTARWWQGATRFLVFGGTDKGCKFGPVPGSVLGDTSFGHYNHINPNFRCTANAKSTTQWWFGGHL
jgi:hypothetical protein